MTIYLKTHITAIGPEVADLAESGVLILFADGSPPELAEVSVMHVLAQAPETNSPSVGTRLKIGALETEITAVGDLAWRKVLDIGHVIISFNAANRAERPGEICAGEIDGKRLVAALQVGETLSICA